MALTGKSCFYFRFIAQIVFSFVMAGVGIGLIIKDWEKKGQAFVVGLMLVSNMVSAWFLNPKKPKTFEEKYKDMVELLKQSKDTPQDVENDNSDTDILLNNENYLEDDLKNSSVGNDLKNSSVGDVIAPRGDDLENSSVGNDLENSSVGNDLENSSVGNDLKDFSSLSESDIEELTDSIPPPPISPYIPSPIPPDLVLSVPSLPPLPSLEKEKIDPEINKKIKEIGMEIKKLNSEL